jgi:hypothetical protein
MKMLSIDEEMLSKGEKGETLNTVTTFRENHAHGISDRLTINLLLRGCATQSKAEVRLTCR